MDFTAQDSGRDSCSKLSTKKNYSSPSLVEFGSIQKLSLGGSASVPEAMVMANATVSNTRP